MIDLFETDEDRSYFITRLFVHEGFTGEVNQVNDNFAQKNERSLSEVLNGVLSQKDIDKVKPILNILEEKGFISPKEAERSCGK